MKAHRLKTIHLRSATITEREWLDWAERHRGKIVVGALFLLITLSINFP